MSLASTDLGPFRMTIVAWHIGAYQMLRGWASPCCPELGIVAEWVGLNHPAIAASPWRIRKWLRRRPWPKVDPREVQGVGQQGTTWREHLCNHCVCLECLQEAHHACAGELG